MSNVQEISRRLMDITELLRGSSEDRYDCPEFYTMLYMLTRMSRPRVIVEVGVHHGFSSLMFLRAIEYNKKGKLYSIDIGPTTTIATEDIGKTIPEQLKKNWQLIIGDAREKLPKLLDELGSIDMFLYDIPLSEKEDVISILRKASYHLSFGGILIIDDPADYVERFFWDCDPWREQGYGIWKIPATMSIKEEEDSFLVIVK